MSKMAMSMSVNSTGRTVAERESRLNTEKRLRDDRKPVIPRHLTDSQRKIWKKIVAGVEKSGILSSTDEYVLEVACTSIDRIQKLNKRMNEDEEAITDVNVRKALEENTKIFFRSCSELCLSPQGRAKMANAVSQNENPQEMLKRILLEDDDAEI